MAGPEVLNQLVAAAQATDADAVRRLIDWPLSGAPRMLRGAHGISAATRARVVAHGLVQLDAVGDDPDLAANAIFEQAPFLVPVTGIEPATEEERDEALRALHIEPLPEGLTPEQVERGKDLAARANAITEVYVTVGEHGRHPYAIAPDTGLVVILLV